jgi:hypothetical protein
MSERTAGVSSPPFDTLNLGDAVGDDPACVRENRARFAHLLGAAPVYLRQLHGTRVVRVGAEHVGGQPLEADSALTTTAGVACTVQVADCMPVLLAAPGGRAVAAVHAGWRGLAAGAIEAALTALCDAAGCSRGEVAAWLGPCIGPRRFEVGPEVVQAFGAALHDTDPQRFMPRARPDGQMRWLANLPQLGRDRLHAAGIRRIAGGHWCTFEDRARFFSFRRDGTTGRLAAAVWIRP